MMRFKCSRQRTISGNKISKRWVSPFYNAMF
jgi:hypothetical protein